MTTGQYQRRLTSLTDGMEKDPFIGRVLDGRYVVMDLVGRGGMAAVYRGQHSVIERQVAIKILSPKSSGIANIKKRFYREARVVIRIQHPNVLDVIDLGETEEGLLYLVMDFLTGESIWEHLEGKGKFEPEEAVDIVCQACKGLGRAHDLGIIHRDITPSNIFLANQGGGSWTVRVLDFGIAFMKDETRLSVPGTVLGTPHYMAPEYAMGKDVVPASDIYSMGAVAYEMICGQPPFDARDYSSIIMMHVRDEPPDLSTRVSGLPDRLVKTIMRCLAKHPEDRFSSAYELHDALEAVARDMEAKRARLRGASKPAASTPAASSHVPAPAPAAVGLDVLRSYVERAGSTAPPGGSAEDLGEMFSRLERLESAIADSERKIEDADQKVQAARDRFARARNTLEEEYNRINRDIAVFESQLDQARTRRMEEERRIRDFRTRIFEMEGGTEMDTIGPVDLPETLADAYESVGRLVSDWREAAQAEKAQDEHLGERQGELRDIRFQIEQLGRNSDEALARLEGTVRGLRMLHTEQTHERARIHRLLVDRVPQEVQSG